MPCDSNPRCIRSSMQWGLLSAPVAFASWHARCGTGRLLVVTSGSLVAAGAYRVGLLIKKESAVATEAPHPKHILVVHIRSVPFATAVGVAQIPCASSFLPATDQPAHTGRRWPHSCCGVHQLARSHGTCLIYLLSFSFVFFFYR
jgi:hypothetical protein